MIYACNSHSEERRTLCRKSRLIPSFRRNVVNSKVNQMFNSAPNETLNCTASPAFLDRQGDFEGVVSRYSPVLFGIAFRRLRNVEDAEDAVQDALLSAYEHIGQFEGRSQLSSWLTRIVINTAGMKLRKRLRREVVSLDEVPVDGGATLADELAAAGPNPESICAQTETQAMVRRALAQISPKLRVAFQMREVGGYSTRETAKALGITTNTLKSRIRRARAAVGVYLETPVGNAWRTNRRRWPRVTARPLRVSRGISAGIARDSQDLAARSQGVQHRSKAAVSHGVVEHRFRQYFRAKYRAEERSPSRGFLLLALCKSGGRAPCE